MYTKSTVATALLAASFTLADPHGGHGDDAAGVKMAVAANAVSSSSGSSAAPTTTSGGMPPHIMPAGLEMPSAEKIQALKGDLQSYLTSLTANPMAASVKAVMATAVPASWKDAVKQNPASFASEAKAGQTPAWVQAVPQDVKDFMESNRKAVKSIMEKNLGPMPTEAIMGGKSAETAAGQGVGAAKAVAATTTARTSGQSSGAVSLRVGMVAVGLAAGLFAVTML